MEEAILLARNAVMNGITQVIATPHHNVKHRNESFNVKEAVFNLNRELSLKSIPLNIFPGQEISYYNSMVGDIEDGLLTLANSGKYILIELPHNHFPLSTFEILLNIQLNGYIPIIAHPERNSVIRRDKQLLYEIVSKGALLFK